MPVGLFDGLGAALAWGLTDVTAALSGRRFGSLPTVALSQVSSLAVLAAASLLLTGGLPFDSGTVLPSVVIGALAGIAYLAFFTALRLGPIAVVSPVVSTYGGLTVILAVIFLGESLGTGQAIGAVLGTVGVLLVGFALDGDLRKTRFVGPGVPFALVAFVAFGFLTIALTGPIHAAGWLPVVFASRIGQLATAVGALVVVRLVGRRRAGGEGPDPVPGRHGAVAVEAGIGAAAIATRAGGRFGRVAYALPIVVGLLDLGGYIVFSMGLQSADAWLVGLTSSFAPAIAVLVAVAVLGERLRPVQWAGLATLAAGVVLVARG